MSWFSNLVHKFGHILQHVGAALAESVGVMFGIPPGATFALTELIMHAHAGDHNAKAKLAKIAANPKYKAALLHINQHLQAHPDFHQFAHHARMGTHPHGPHHVHHHAFHGHRPLPPGAHQHLAAGYVDVGRSMAMAAQHGGYHVTGGFPETVGAWPHHAHHGGHHGHHHGHHGGHGFVPHGATYGPGVFGYGGDWIMGEQDALSRIPSPADGEPENWYTRRMPRGTPGIGR